MSCSIELNYEPLECSDVTVNFGNIVFHVHSTILKKESKVLAVAVDGADTKCELTEACKKPGHRCFALSSPFGTTTVNDSQMKSFFDHMYDPTKLFETPTVAVPVGADSKPILLGAIVHSLVIRHRPIWNGGVVTGHVGSKVEVTTAGSVYLVSANEIHQTGSAVTCISKSFQRFGFEHLRRSDVLIRLCHFFDCAVFLRSFRNYINALYIDTDVLKQPADMLALLSLCDYCRFDDFVKPTVMELLKHKANFDANEWNKLIKPLRSETSAVIVQAAFARANLLCD